MFLKKIPDTFFLLIVVLLGLAIRLDFAIPHNFIIDADEGIVGIMAKHIAEGKEIPTFYYGQNYMGSFEPLLAGIVFKIFGISNFGLKVVPLLFSLILIVLVYALAKAIAGRYCGRIAALITAIPPVSLVVWSSKARGGFIELLVIGGLAFLIAINEFKKKKLTPLPIFFIFLFLGFGWWVNNQIIFFILPICLSYLLAILAQSGTFSEKIKTTFTLAVSALISFFIGGLPFWIYNFQHKFISFEMFTSAKQTKISDHFWGLIDYSIPILMGSKHFWETDDIFAYSTVVYCVIYALIFAAFLYFYRHELFKNPYILLTSFILCTFSIFVVSSFGHLYQAPRYLLPTYISIFIIIALVINKLNSISPHFANTATVVILCLNLLSAYAGGRAIPGEPIVYNYDRVSKDHSELITWLAEQNITAVKTNYWIGYRLAFETEEKVKFLVFQHPTQTRIKSYKEDILNHYDENKIPLILSPTQIPLIKSALTTLGYQYLEKQIANYTIIYNIEEIHKNLIAIPEADFTLKASSKNENINLVLDKDNKTRWGSGEPQNPNMNIIAEFRQPNLLRGVNLDFTNFETDYPRKLVIEAELEDGSKKVLLDEQQYKYVSFYLEEEPPLHINFDPIKVRKLILKQTGSDTFFDWSVSELSFEQ